MRSRTKLKLTGRTEDGWYPWFAWYPVRVYVPIIEPNDPKDRAWVTAWLETVEWIERDSLPREQHSQYYGQQYVYRFKGENR